MPGNGTRAYQQFGFRILNHIILPGTQCAECSVAYTVDLKEACQQIKEGEYQLPCPRNGPHTEVLRLVADARDGMPSESANPPQGRCSVGHVSAGLTDSSAKIIYSFTALAL